LRKKLTCRQRIDIGCVCVIIIGQARKMSSLNVITEVIKMRKNLGVQPALFPMPVVIVAAYGADGNICAMNAAWAQICDMDKIALFIDADHKTTKNIMETKAFTVSIADVPNMETADFFGIATGNKMPDKFERSGCHAVKSEFVNAPIITEYPVTIECELAEEINTENMHAIVGKIVNVSAEESVVGDKDKILPEKVNALVFDQYRNGYFSIGEKIGQAWNAGAGLMKK